MADLEEFVPPEFPDANDSEAVQAREAALAAETPEWVTELPDDPDSTAGTGSTADATVDMQRDQAAPEG